MKKNLTLTLFLLFLGLFNLKSQTTLPVCFKYNEALSATIMHCPVTVCIDVLLDEGTTNARIERICHTFNYNDEYCFTALDVTSGGFITSKIIGAMVTNATTSTGSYLTFPDPQDIFNGSTLRTQRGTGCDGLFTFFYLEWNIEGWWTIGSDAWLEGE